MGLSNVAPPHISARLEINKDQKQSQGFQYKIALKHHLLVRLTHPKKDQSMHFSFSLIHVILLKHLQNFNKGKFALITSLSTKRLKCQIGVLVGV